MGNSYYVHIIFADLITAFNEVDYSVVLSKLNITVYVRN